MLRQIAYKPRTETTDLVKRYLHLRFDVNVVSPRGNGGTEFLRELRDELIEDNIRVLFLPETAERSALPHAFMSMLRDPARPGNMPSSPAALAAQLSRALDGRPLVVIADGVSGLTPTVISALTLYRQQAGVQTLVLTNAPLLREVLPGPGLVVDLPVLTLEDVHGVLFHRLGSRLETTSINRVYSKSAGLIKLAIAICEVARVEGSLRLIDGQWVAVRDLWSDALTAFTWAYTYAVTPEQRGALEMIALVGLVDVPEAEQMIGHDMLQSLEQSGAVTVDPNGRNHWVTANPPLLSEMFRHTMLPARRAHLRAQIEQISSLRYLEAEPHELEMTTLVIEPSFLRLVTEKRNEDLVGAETAWHESRSPAAALNYTVALVNSNADPHAILNLIEEATREEMPAEFRSRLAVWEAWLHGYCLGDVARADQLLQRREHAGEYWGFLVAARIRMLADLATVPHDAVALLSETAKLPLTVQNEMHRTLAFIYVSQGLPEEAAEALGRVSSWSDDYFPYLQNSTEALIELVRGRFDRAREIALQGARIAQDELDERSLRAHGHMLSLLLLVRGQHEGILQIEDYVEALGGVPLFPRMSYLGVKVCAAIAAHESPSGLREIVSALDEIDLPDGPLLGTSRSWARARLAALEGSPAQAAEECWEGATALYARGSTLAAALGALRSLDYLFDEARLATLQQWIEPMQSEHLLAYRDYIVARHTSDSDAMLAVIPRLIASGRLGLAVQGYDHAAAIARSHGDIAYAEEIEAHEAEFLDSLEPGTYDAAQQEPTGAKLTAREREVAELMAQGMTNRQIKDHLVLSIRTVENHVHRMMRKLDVSTRREAVEWIRAWLGSGEI
ncbi:helix-turn-helix transcriptional regulator [Leucobacter luti]|uniref:Regulatory LuxR family protein n=1 Tax=Leucobacter luti TaxID=340320 RepID=A0A4Q7TY46_9MICO|nr:helix-turn-helix transcriptional regulator [Leucobacter luti]RZT66126.1 regulatory LuxR family protein [Leucobacter luti]